MMFEKPSKRPARPKINTQHKKTDPTSKSKSKSSKKGNIDKKTELLKAPSERVFSIRELAKGFKVAARTPQVRVPKTRWSRSKSTTIPTQRIRTLRDDSYSHIMTTEGSLEPIFLKQCELDSSLEKTLAQPFIVDFEGYLGLGRFTMDFACYPRYGKPFAVDVKNKDALESAKYGPLVAARKQAFIDHGFELRTFTEDDLASEPKRSNIIQLYSCLNRDPNLLKKATRTLKQELILLGGSAYLDSFAHLPARTVKWGTAYGLYCGQFTADFSNEFGANFLINLENRNE